MTYSQKKLLVLWGCFLLIMTFASFNSKWVHENWDWLRWASLIVILFMFVRGGKEATGWGKPGVNLTEFIDTYPIAKLWVTLSALIIILFLAYAFIQGIEFHESAGMLMLVGFGSMFAPLFIFAEYLRFKRLGSKSNKAVK